MKKSKMISMLLVCVLAMPMTAFASEVSTESEDGRERFFANGNAIILDEGTTEGYTVIYLDENSNGAVDAEDSIVTISSAVGSADEAGYDLEEFSIFGGSSSDLEGNNQITMLGGTVGLIYGGNFNSDLVGNVIIDLQGGMVMNQVYGGGVSSDTVGDVTLIFGADSYVQWVAYAGGNTDSITLGNITIELHEEAEIGRVYAGGNDSTVSSYEEPIIEGNASIIDLEINFLVDEDLAPSEDTEDDTDVEAEDDTDVEAEDDADTETEDDADTETEEDADIETEEDADTETEDDTDVETEDDADTETEDDADTETEDDADTETEDEAVEDTGADTGDANGAMIWIFGFSILGSVLVGSFLVYKKKVLMGGK